MLLEQLINEGAHIHSIHHKQGDKYSLFTLSDDGKDIHHFPNVSEEVLNRLKFKNQTLEALEEHGGVQIRSWKHHKHNDNYSVSLVDANGAEHSFSNVKLETLCKYLDISEQEAEE